MQLSTDWKLKLDDFNACHPNHPPVMIRWEPRAVWAERTVWVCGVPVRRNEYEPRWQVGVVLDNKPKGPVTYIEGSGGLWFFKLFNWQMQDTKEFLDLDDRIFDCLVDSTPHGFYDEAIEQPAIKVEEQGEAEARELAYAGASYYYGHDNLIINPHVKAGGNWRWRTR